jgi:hypothetical protein
MKLRTVIMMLLVLGCIYLWKTPGSLEMFRNWFPVTARTPSKADRTEELLRLRDQLDFEEKALSKITEQMDSIRANAPYCPIEGARATTVFPNDPRPAICKKIKEIQARIDQIQ